MKTIDIKGKEYVTVNERVIYFRENFPNWSMTTDIIDYNDESVLMKAEIADETGRVVATGFAREEKSSSYINKTSYIENCETSAWGRALANLGVGIDTSMCSAEELINAVNNQNKPEKKTYDYRAALIKFIKENTSLTLEDVSKEYGLTKSSSQEEFHQALDRLKIDLGM